MEPQTWPIALLSALLILITTLLIHLRRPTRNFPPGPKAWPVIGNLHQIGPIPHCSFHSLSKIYGPLLHLRFGSLPVVVVSSPGMAEQFLKTNDEIFASRPALAAGKYTNYNYSDLSWAPYGAYWRQLRKVALTGVFNVKKLEGCNYILEEEKLSFIRRLYSAKSINLRDELTRYTLSSIIRMVMGDKYFGSVIKIKEFQELIDEWFLLNGVINLGDWIPWLGFLDVQGYVKRMKTCGRKADMLYSYVVNDHRNKGSIGSAEKEDMLDALLKLADDPNLEVKLTDDSIKGLMQNLITGGTDTSATTVQWAVLELLKHPDILSKAKNELDQVIGNQRWVHENDFAQLPYLDSVIKETFRLHPLATLLVPHFATQDCKIEGYDILKGTMIFINTWSIGRDPQYWDEPEEFKPERYFGKNANVDIKGHSFELLPFGAGRRRCPGFRLGLDVVRSTLANLLHGFVWKLPNDMKAEDICMDELYGITTRPKVSLKLLLEPRLPLHLY